MNNANNEHASEWTDQETLLLLEGIEMFQEDWTKVAQHVGKTREECLKKFLGLPIEDTYLGNNDNDLGPLKYNRQPFNPADNPILTLATFMASIVPPSVAQKAGI